MRARIGYRGRPTVHVLPVSFPRPDHGKRMMKTAAQLVMLVAVSMQASAAVPPPGSKTTTTQHEDPQRTSSCGPVRVMNCENPGWCKTDYECCMDQLCLQGQCKWMRVLRTEEMIKAFVERLDFDRGPRSRRKKLEDRV